MSATRHADTARDALIAAAGVAFSATTQAGKDYATAHKALVAGTDVVDVMAATASAIMAAEHLGEAVAQAVKDLRFVLAQQMSETGATKVQPQDGAITAFLQRKPAYLSVGDRTKIPRQFFVAREPELDMKAVKAAIEAGTDVPECSIVRPNDLRLVIKSNAKEWGT